MRQPRGQLGKDSKQRTQRGLSPRGGDVPGVFQESTVAEAQSEQGSKERNQGSEAGGWVEEVCLALTLSDMRAMAGL